MAKKVNKLGVFYNNYMDNNFDIPFIDYRKDNTVIDNNMATYYGKKNSQSFNTQLTGQYLYTDTYGNDKNNYINSYTINIKPKPNINILGAKLLA